MTGRRDGLQQHRKQPFAGNNAAIRSEVGYYGHGSFFWQINVSTNNISINSTNRFLFVIAYLLQTALNSLPILKSHQTLTLFVLHKLLTSIAIGFSSLSSGLLLHWSRRTLVTSLILLFASPCVTELSALVGLCVWRALSLITGPASRLIIAFK